MNSLSKKAHFLNNTAHKIRSDQLFFRGLYYIELSPLPKGARLFYFWFMTLGRINKLETFGSVDGPGIRFVVFTQGCPYTKADIAYQNDGLFLNLIMRYTFQQALDHSSEGSQTWGNQIPYIPRHSGGVDFTAKWKEWAFSWNTVFTGARWSRTANIPDYYIKPWTTTDLSFSRSFSFKDNRGLKACLSCNNLFNQHYQIVQGYPMPGTNLIVTIEYNW